MLSGKVYNLGQSGKICNLGRFCAMAGLNPAGKTGRQGYSSDLILGFACNRLRVDSSTNFGKPSSAERMPLSPPEIAYSVNLFSRDFHLTPHCRKVTKYEDMLS